MPKFVWDVDPVLATIAGNQIRYYGVCFVLSLAVAYFLFDWQLRRGGGDREEAGDFWSYGGVGLFVGARVGHVLAYEFARFAEDPTMVWKIWQGGFASHGAVAGLAVALHWFTKRRAIPFLEGSDRLVFAVLPGAFLFRLGNLFNSEIVGKPTDGSWGIQFPRFDLSSDGPYRHPTALYEMALAVLVFALVLAADRSYGREARPRGALTGILLVSLFSGRFLIEFLKEPQPGEVVRFLNRGQVLSVPFIVIGAALLVMSVRRPMPVGWIVGSAVVPKTARDEDEDADD